MPKLFVVATPIGNLEDITFRAVRILAEVDLIAAEDTRKTKNLLNKYNINTPLTSYHKFNIKAKSGYIIRLLQEGKNIALVTDAGTPGVSDPGQYLISKVLAEKIEVVGIPGPCALITALSVSGVDATRFVFQGFLPRKSGQRRKLFESLKEEKKTSVFYESPHRILKTLDDLAAVLPERRIILARELTKKFEEVLLGTAAEVKAKLKPKGEMVLIIAADED